ncbi:hypothetical protein MycrhN_0311 [Mycolicibacterium rhodesiae NBB3]|uniref:Uncharacterized protein n=1 Tax=Mycolicibacterium rhodesiae (strain NBB3) TaxID=710685 RepID=G8RIW5_MYCRN|nr:hypothetical protein MycrhN_0311 [Mycolicibacterium rhodesiae NBB3]
MLKRPVCKAVGLARSTYRRLLLTQVPTDPGPKRGLAVRYDERSGMNTNKVYRLARGVTRGAVHSPRKRAEASSVLSVRPSEEGLSRGLPPVDSAIRGKAAKTASMFDNTQDSRDLIQTIARSPARRSSRTSAQTVFASDGGLPIMLWMYNCPYLILKSGNGLATTRSEWPKFRQAPLRHHYIDRSTFAYLESACFAFTENTPYEARGAIGGFRRNVTPATVTAW